MRNKQQLITYSYHFINEAIIIFMLTLPLFYFQYNFIPYWEYLIIIVGLSFIYTIYLNYTKSYAFYVVTAPFIGLLFYLLHYPIFISIVFPILITWRSIELRRQLSYQLNNENKYLLTTFILTFILFILLKDYLVIVYAFIQLFILYVGYMSSHFLLIKKEERKQVDRKLPFYILGVLVIGVIVIFPLFNIGRFIIKHVWNGVMYLFIFVAGGIVWLFEFINLNFGDGTPPEESYVMEGEEHSLEANTVPLIDIVGPYLFWGLLIAVAFIIILIGLRLIRKRFKEQEIESDEDVSTYKQLSGGARREKNLFNRLYDSLFQRPSHPVRRLLYQFERKMIGTSYERHSFETIDRWSKRIGLATNLEVYQKVRYGNLEVNNEEVEKFKKELDAFTKRHIN